MVNRTAYFIITNECNQKCKYCFYQIGYYKRFIETEFQLEDAKILIRNLKKAGFKEISFTGGEAFMYKYILEIIDFAHQVGLIVTLCTNGTLLTREDIEDLKANGLNNIYISLDALNEEIHNKCRGNYQLVHQTLINVLDVDFDVVGINLVLTRYNFKSVGGILKYCKENNILLSVTPVWLLLENNDLQSELVLNQNEQMIYINSMLNLADEYGVTYYEKSLIFFNVEKLQIPKQCQVSSSDLVIQPNGDILPCFFNKTVLGNVFNDSFDKILNIRDAYLRTEDLNLCFSKFCSNLVWE